MLAFRPAYVIRLQSAATLWMIYKAVLAPGHASRSGLLRQMDTAVEGFHSSARCGSGVEADWLS